MIARGAAVATLLVLAAACNGGSAAQPSATDAASPSTPASPTEPGSSGTSVAADPPRVCDPSAAGVADEVTVWHVLSPGVGLTTIDGLWPAFIEQTGVNVRSEAVGGYDQLTERLATTDPAQWPDLVIAPLSAARTLLDSGRFMPPAACADVQPLRDDMLPVVDATYSFDGGLFALPFGVSTPVLYFDAAKFRAAGLDPRQPPATLEELMQTSRQLVDAGVSPYGFVLYDWVGQWVVDQYAARTGLTIGSADNGRSPGAVSVDVATDVAVESFETFRRGVLDGHVTWIGPNVDNVANLFKLVDPVAGGAMTIHTSGSLGDIFQLVDAGSFPGQELAIGPLPGPASGGLAGGNGIWLVGRDDPARVGAAWNLAAWLVEPAQIATLSAATGYVPFTRAAAQHPTTTDAWIERPALRVAYEQLADMPGNPAAAGLLIGPASDREFVMYAASSRIIEGADATAELESASEQINRLIDAYDASN